MYLFLYFIVAIVLGRPLPNNDLSDSFKYTGKTDAQEGAHANVSRSWPWVCSIGVFDPDDKDMWIHVCTGTIATAKHVITTVGCLIYFDDLNGPENIIVRAGNEDFTDVKGMQTRTMSSYVKHPNYDKAKYQGYFDIAVLSMKEDFIFTSSVRPISLPEINNDGLILKENTPKGLILPYWGTGGIGNENKKMEIKTRFIQLAPEKICQKTYNNLDFEYLQCGSDASEGICDIDFGSPTFILDDNIDRYVLQGLLLDVNLDLCEIDKKKPNLIVPITTTCNIQFIYEQLYNRKFPKLMPDGTKICDEEFYNSEGDNLIYENCGHIDTVDDRRISNYPWQVSLGYKTSKKWFHICGGSIVTRNKIITAGHCIIENFRKLENMIEVRAGDNYLQNPTDDEGLQLKTAANYSTHPKYNLTAQIRYFDVGIVTLTSYLEITKFVRPICLRNLKEAKATPKNAETDLPLTTTGWGHKDLDPNAQEFLKNIQALILSEKTCNDSYIKEGSYEKSVPYLFTSDLLCARDPTWPNGDDGTCNGDSGGPAVYNNQDLERHFLYGVVGGNALGECDTLKYPNIYVRTSDVEVLRYIIEQVQQAPKNVKIEGKKQVEQKQTVMYTCLADSYPVSRLHWTVYNSAGLEIQTKKITNNSIEFDTSNESKNFVIQCQAKNRLGSSNVTLIVGGSSNVTLIVGGSSNVTLTVVGIVIVVLILIFLLLLYTFKEKCKISDRMNQLGGYIPLLLLGNSDFESRLKAYREKVHTDTEDDTIYINRAFVMVNPGGGLEEKKRDNDSVLHVEFHSLDEIVSTDVPALIQGEAGSGKSCLSTKSTMDWAQGNILGNIDLLINISARKFNNPSPISFLTILMSYTSLSNISTGMKNFTYDELQSLAKSGNLAFFIDGLDELAKFCANDVDLEELKFLLLRVKENPSTEITLQQFIIGILTRNIFEGAVIIGTGRPYTIQRIKSELMDNNCTIYALKPFDEKDVNEMVYSDPHSNEQSRHAILKKMEDKELKKLAETPYVCKLLIKYFTDKKDIQANECNFSVIRLDFLLKSFQSEYYKNGKGFTEMVKTYKTGLDKILNLCFQSLQDNVTDIEGWFEDGNFKSDSYDEISFEMIEKSNIFKIVHKPHSRKTISTNHLSDHEFLASAIACKQNAKDLTSCIQKMDIERSIAVLTHMVNLLSGEDTIQLNFRNFLGIKEIERMNIIRLAYDQVIKMPIEKVLEYDNKDKNQKLNFTASVKEGERLRTSQIVLIAKLVSASKVSPNLMINQTGKEWELILESTGYKGFTSNEVEDILILLEVQGVIPTLVTIKGDCGKGTTAVLGDFVKRHTEDAKVESNSSKHSYFTKNPKVKLNCSNRCYFRLTTQDDIINWIELISKNFIDISKIGVVHLNAKCDSETSKELIPMMVEVKHIRVYAEQNDEFWKQLEEKTVTKKQRLDWLRLAGFKTTDTNIDSIVHAIRQADQVMLFMLDMKSSHLLKLSEALNNKEQSKIHRLMIKEIKISLDGVDAMVHCMGAVKGDVELENMALTTDIWQQMGNGFQKMVKDGGHQLKNLTFMKNTINLDNVEAITRCMGVIESTILNLEDLTDQIRSKIGDGLLAMSKSGELKLKDLEIKHASAATIPKDFLDMLKKAGVAVKNISSLTLTTNMWDQKEDSLQTMVKDGDHHIKSLTIVRNTIKLDNVAALTRFMGSIERVVLNNDDLTERLSPKIGEGLIEMRRNGELKLKNIEIKDATAATIPKDFLNMMKKARVVIKNISFLKLTTDVWDQMGDSLQTMVKDGDHDIKSLTIIRNMINLGNVEALTKFMGFIERVILNNEDLTIQIRRIIGDSLIKMRKNGELKLKHLEIKDAKAAIIPRDFLEKIKEAEIAIKYKASITLTTNVWDKKGDDLQAMVKEGDHHFKNLTIIKNTINTKNVLAITRCMGAIESAELNTEDLTETISHQIGNALIEMTDHKLKNLVIKDGTDATTPMNFLDMMLKAGVTIHYKSNSEKEGKLKCVA